MPDRCWGSHSTVSAWAATAACGAGSSWSRTTLDFERLGHLPVTALPGGTRALLEPWRNTWAQLHTQLGWERVESTWGTLELVDWLRQRPLPTLQKMLQRGLNSPPSSSAGRLFDAVAGALNLCRAGISYEGQAAIELENLALRAGRERGSYAMPLRDGSPTLGELWPALLDDLAGGVDPARIAARFHNGLAGAVIACARHWCAQRALDTVALSGGVMQNRTLFGKVEKGLQDAGLEVLSHHQVPANDGGIALGQALIGATHPA